MSSYKFILSAIFSLGLYLSGISQKQNLLLVENNEPIQFQNINAAVVREAVATLIKESDARVEKIISIPVNAKNTVNTLMVFDKLNFDLGFLGAKLNTIASTYTDDATRDAANEESGKLGVYSTNLFLDERLYKAIKAYASTAGAKQLKPNQKKFLNESIIAFEKNGMKLDAQGRKELQALSERLINLGIEFDRNIAEYKDSVSFTGEELAGVAENIKKPWKRANGKYMVYINGPNYTEIVTNASHPETRHTIYLRYNNRAYPKNIKTLDSLFYYRNLFAKKLGFSSYAAYSTIDKMAGSPARVWSFEKDLIKKLAPNVTRELNELKAFKKELEPGSDNTLNAWDISYYNKKRLDSKYKVNSDEVKQYFEMNNTLKGMFTVYEKLFSIKIVETKGVPVWYSKVKSFEMFKEGKRIGIFYLDLFPRPNKYTHFACFPISGYHITDGKEVLPVSALICNFPEGNESEPSLLYHSDVVTLFHEFGHLVHSMLGRSDLASQGPFSVKGDFTEAPSQFLENWVWQYESLKLFAKHYKTGEVLPLSLYNRMKQTQTVGVAIQYMRQAFLGITDFTYEDKYDSISKKDIMQVAKDLYTINQLPFPEGSHFIASFTHLNGYAANYYGYLWSKVFAEDMFSEFKKKGVMNTALGLRYRKEVLEKASTKEEIDMLRAFLGREPNSDAFLKSLGLK
jgi:Zn-dependent oligopeptidase